MTILALGELSPDNETEGALRSGPVPIPLLDNLPLSFVLLNFGEDDQTDIEHGIEVFLALGAEARAQAATEVYNNFLEFREGCCYDDVDCEVESEAKVWDLVHPTGVDIFRRREDDRIYLQIMAECDWEREHGLQLLYRDDGSLVNVSDQCSGLAWQDT